MDVTLSKLFQEYEMFKAVKTVTKAKARSAFRHLVTFCGDIPARELSPGRVNKFATWLGNQALNTRTGNAGLSGHTVKTTVGAAAQVYAWSLRQRGVDGQCEYGLTLNPFCGADRVRVDAITVRFYREEEAADILHAASELHWRDRTKTLAWCAAIRLAVQAGLRKGEILNLRWQDVDLGAGKVLIRHRLDKLGEYWAWISKGRHEGEVPMGDTLWAAMMRLREIRPWTYPFLTDSRLTDLKARSWPLPEHVRDCPANNWTREFNRILCRTNRNRQLNGKEIISAGDFHQLRKTAGTWLAERGVPEHYVQATLRHASPETTRKYYVGINHRECEARVREVINAIDL